MQKQQGFTLIEMVVAVAIVGILASIAWAAYQSQSAKGRRSDATVALTNGRQALISFRSDNGAYPADAATALAELRNYRPTAANTPPIDCKDGRGYQVPGGGGVISCQGYYTITVTAANANSFTLTATPILADADCTTMTLDNLGTRGSTGTGPLDRCWAQ